jgi:ATP-dependent exoDNAse (exonuclease V) alpha subunit
MPQFHIDMKAISRSAGRSAPAAAAYRAGERIRDERSGHLHNYTRRQDVVHTEILLPSALGAGAADWARDRARLWNAAEAAEHRRDSRVAREYQVSLPHELCAAQRLELVRRFSREIADRHDIAVDLSIHDPKSDGDPRNFHAHLLVTTREIGETGLGRKAGLDLSIPESLKRGLKGLREMHFIRERWAVLTNDAYREAGLDLRVDHRSLAAQGIDRVPKRHIPFIAFQMERRRMRQEIADGIAERYRERIAASAPQQEMLASGQVATTAPTPLNPNTTGADKVRRRARDAWLALRREAAASAGPARVTDRDASQAPERSSEAAAARDEDLAL